jgi:hypothetical protein
MEQGFASLFHQSIENINSLKKHPTPMGAFLLRFRQGIYNHQQSDDAHADTYDEAAQKGEKKDF